MAVSDHAPDGTDDRGLGLVITIRIAPDGRLYFHDLTPDLLPVAVAMSPGDPVLRAREAMAERLGQEPIR